MEDICKVTLSMVKNESVIRIEHIRDILDVREILLSCMLLFGVGYTSIGDGDALPMWREL